LQSSRTRKYSHDCPKLLARLPSHVLQVLLLLCETEGGGRRRKEDQGEVVAGLGVLRVLLLPPPSISFLLLPSGEGEVLLLLPSPSSSSRLAKKSKRTRRTRLGVLLLPPLACSRAPHDTPRGKRYAEATPHVARDDKSRHVSRHDKRQEARGLAPESHRSILNPAVRKFSVEQ